MGLEILEEHTSDLLSIQLDEELEIQLIDEMPRLQHQVEGGMGRLIQLVEARFLTEVEVEVEVLEHEQQHEAELTEVEIELQLILLEILELQTFEEVEVEVGIVLIELDEYEGDELL